MTDVKPWNDCPPCPSCGQTCGTRCVSTNAFGESAPGDEAPAPGVLRCFSCGHEWTATQAELEQAARADAAWLERLAAVERRETQP